MIKVTIELEVDDDFEPCTYGCEMGCPLGYMNGDGDLACCNMERTEDGYFTCLVKKSIEKGRD